MPLREYLAQAPGFLRAHPRLGQIIGIRALLAAATLALPFYTLFARERLGVSEAAAGIYLAAQKVGEIATGPLWGALSDRFGPALGLRAAAAGVVAAPLLGLAAGLGAPGIYPVVFFLLGGTGSGVWILANNALLEAVEDRDRPLAIGVASLCQAPTALYAVAGGLLLRAGLPYPALFALTALLTALGLLVACRLPAGSRR
jgi:predicted MFS family arabinose efflux permease